MSAGGRAVVVFLPSLEGGGAERSVATVANGLSARAVPVHLVLGRAEGPYLETLHPGVRVHDLRARSALQALPGLMRTLRRVQPKALLSAMSHSNIVAVLAHRFTGSDARLVLSERVNFSAFAQQHQDWRLGPTHLLMRLTYPRADSIVAVSQGVADDLMAHIDLQPGRVVTLPNPVVDESLLVQSQAPPPHPWLQPGATPVLLAAGRLAPQKDFDLLVRAFAQVRTRRELRLMILGEGPERQALQERAYALGVGADVAMPGFLANPFAAMRAAAAFVLSSRYEGLPGVLIQAMACGTRVLSTDCPSGPREVLEDGRWGRLVPVGDVDAMATAITSTLDDTAPPEVRERAQAYTATAAIDSYARVLDVPLSG